VSENDCEKNEKRKEKRSEPERGEKRTHLALWDRVPAEPDPLLRIEQRRLPEQALLSFRFFYVERVSLRGRNRKREQPQLSLLSSFLSRTHRDPAHPADAHVDRHRAELLGAVELLQGAESVLSVVRRFFRFFFRG